MSNARSDGCAVATKENPVPHFDEILTKFAAAFPHGDWETRVENWEEQLRIVQQARPNARCARQDRLYAEIVALEAEPYLSELSRPRSRGSAFGGAPVVSSSIHYQGDATRRACISRVVQGL